MIYLGVNHAHVLLAIQQLSSDAKCHYCQSSLLYL